MNKLGERPTAVPLTRHKTRMTESEAVPMSARLKYGMTTDSGALMSNCYFHTFQGTVNRVRKKKEELKELL